METSRHFRLTALLVLMALLAGCATKKAAGPPLPPPETPVAAASPEPTPEATPSPTPAQQSQLPAQGTPPPEPEQIQPADAKDDKKANNTKPRPTGKKSSSGTRESARNTPPKIVVRPDAEPAATPGQISPSGGDPGRNEPSTDQLLSTTENSLNNLKGQFSAEEQATITQIRDFINQSRQATKENDAARAHNFALKAHLLCDDLIKRR